MQTYDEVVHELDLLLAGVKAIGRAVNLLNSKLDGKRWRIGRLCFQLFGHRKTTETGLTVVQFASERNSSPPRIYEPLRVYRVLGDWYERQIDPAPFTIARLTVQHTQDVADAERLMEIWRQRGETDESDWKSFLSGGKKTKPAEPPRNLSRSSDARAVLTAFDQFEQHVDAALARRFFANRFIPADRAKAVADKINKLNGKRRNLLGLAKSQKVQPAHSRARTTAAEQNRATDRTSEVVNQPAGELIGAAAE